MNVINTQDEVEKLKKKKLSMNINPNFLKIFTMHGTREKNSYSSFPDYSFHDILFPLRKMLFKTVNPKSKKLDYTSIVEN